MRARMVTVLLWASASVAVAQSDAPDMEAFQSHLDSALAHYEARRYADAAADFRRAYEIRAEPELVYNMARSYERALMRAEAIAAYDEFVALPGTTSDMRARALEARNSLRAEVAALREGEVEPEPEPVAEPEPEPEPTVQPEPVTEPPEPSSPLRTVGWAAIGVGAASVLAGAVFGGLAIRANNEFGETTVRAEQEDLRDEVNRNALAADLLVGIGAAAAVAGVLLLWLGKPSDTEEDARVRLQPAVSPTSLGLVVGGRL